MNPIGLENIDWKYLIVYVVWLCFEIVFIYIFFPETYGKTLEELHFCKWLSCYLAFTELTMTVFESEKDERDMLAAAASKVINDPTVIELHEAPDKKA